MIAPKANPADVDNTHNEASAHEGTKPGQNITTMSKSMHDGVEIWCDCCSCEAEPYWVEAMRDYEKSL